MRLTKEQSKWNADAEAAMMGFVVPVQSKEHLEHMVKYVLTTTKGQKTADALTPDVMTSWDKYNSNNTLVSHLSVNKHREIGLMLTMVRDAEMKSLTDEDGVLAYVYNADFPDCSELGYVFFENKNGKIHRIG